MHRIRYRYCVRVGAYHRQCAIALDAMGRSLLWPLAMSGHASRSSYKISRCSSPRLSHAERTTQISRRESSDRAAAAATCLFLLLLSRNFVATCLDRMPHTLVLVQFSGSRDSRKYFDYDQENSAFDGKCARLNSRMPRNKPCFRARLTVDLAPYLPPPRERAACMQPSSQLHRARRRCRQTVRTEAEAT